jgi:hypothetical protein
MAKSILTKYEQYSVFSGSPAQCMHHCIFGKGSFWRKLSEQYGLKIPLLHSEHNASSKGTIHQIHDNIAAEKLSKMLGQVAYEEYYLADKLANGENLGHQSVEEWMSEAREDFRRTFGESFL